MIAAILPLLIFTFLITDVSADIKLKIAVVNPSTTREQTTPVRFDLPKGVGPEHIIDIGKMDLKYDFGKENYYVAQNVTLKPSERLILEIKLRDVWTIPEKDLSSLKAHTESALAKLKGTKHYKIGQELSAKILKRLKEISDRQKAAGTSAGERINLYYENIGMLTEAKDDIGMLENLVLDVGGIVEERVEVPMTLAVAVREDEEALIKEAIELRIKVSNPSQKNKQTTSIKYALPQEVTPRRVLDSAGLDVGYDFAKECFYLYKDSVALEPGETKIFIIKLRDIWRIPDTEMGALKSHTNNLMLLLKDTEFAAQGKAVADKIAADIDEINSSQALVLSATEHIARFRANVGLLEDIRKSVAEIEKMVSQAGASPGVTVARAEERKGGGREVKRPRGYEGLALIAKSIFKGKAPTTATTWKIIWSIVGFLGIVSLTFYTIQLIHHKISTTDLLTGTHTRTYLINRLQEIHRKAEGARSAYSVLMMDIDNFKSFNDNYGHATGDTVLRTVSSAIRQNIVRDFLVGRFGGDEFVILMPGIDRDRAELVGEKLRKAIEQVKITYMGQPLSVHASVGIAAYPANARTIDVLFSKVDDAMYSSKRAGGNKVTIAA